MRVLHLLAYPEDVGGILPLIRDLKTAMAAAGEAYEHVVWVNEGFVGERSPALDHRFTTMDARGPIGPRNLGRGARDLGRLLARERFDLLHAHDRHGTIAGLVQSVRRRVPLVVTVHLYSPKRWFYGGLRRLPRVHPVYLTRHMAEFYGCSDESRIDIIPDSCPDLLLDRPIGHATYAFTPERPLRLLGLGLFHVWKNWKLLIEAVGMLSTADRARVRLVLRGKPSNVDSSLRYAGEMADAVTSLGVADSVAILPFTERPQDEIDGCDWFVLPSIMEPCSVALAEGMAAGKPVLVSRSGGNVELVEDGVSGRFIDPHDPADIAEKIREILAGHPGMRLDPAAIRDAVRGRLASRVAPRYADVYRKALGAGAALG